MKASVGIRLRPFRPTRAVNAAEIAGIRAVLVHALSDPVRVFYAGCGFRPSPTNPMTLMATLADINKALDPEA